MSIATILLVEDNPALRQATTLLLEAHDFRIVGAGTVDDALQALAAAPCCDLVLLDLDLGEARGEQLFDRRGELTRALPPLVVVSGQSANECEHARRHTQAAAVVRKPYMPHELLAAVEDVLRAA